MCRLLAIVAREPQGFERCLRESPRSLAVLGREHPDGWGIAVHETKVGWKVTKKAACATTDPEFNATAADAAGVLLVARVRKRTVGEVSFENTHPLRRGDWVFAHNGTIEQMSELQTAGASTSDTTTGNTDSALLFAFLMARLASHPAASGSRLMTDMVLARAVEDLGNMSSLGTATFVLSDGAALYAYRHGRPLYLLERRSQDRLEAILVASEAITTEAWSPLAERTLLAIWRRPSLGRKVLFAPRQRSGGTLQVNLPEVGATARTQDERLESFGRIEHDAVVEFDEKASVVGRPHFHPETEPVRPRRF